MRRRVGIGVAALCAGCLGLGAASAGAAKHKHGAGTQPAPAFTPVAKTTCKTKTGITVAAGDIGVAPPVKKGSEFGSAVCRLFGRGVQADTFKVPETGDNHATYQMYFPTGTIHGKYVLTPQTGNFGPESFSETDYIGKLTITGGTGTYQGAQGIGTMTCKTMDGIHTTCTDRIKLKQL